MTTEDWDKILVPLREGAEKLRAAAGAADAEAKRLGDDTLGRDLALLAEQALDLYEQAAALRVRVELERTGAPGDG